jgi:hypothetical protein
MALPRERRRHPCGASMRVPGRGAADASADRGVDRWDGIPGMHQAEARDSLSAADPDSPWIEVSRERPGAPVLRAVRKQCRARKQRAAPPRALQARLPVQ